MILVSFLEIQNKNTERKTETRNPVSAIYVMLTNGYYWSKLITPCVDWLACASID